MSSGKNVVNIGLGLGKDVDLRKTAKFYREEHYTFGKLKFMCTRDRILPSLCNNDHLVPDAVCQHCRFQEELALPALPDMVYPNNVLNITRSDRLDTHITFQAFDALKLVDITQFPKLEVHASQSWKQAREDVKRLPKRMSTYDWTYTTPYTGTLAGFKEVPTNAEIDRSALMRRDPINFFIKLPLYEDELADNGASELSIRLRIMPSCFLLLQRFYLRVDDVFVRIYDTRMYGVIDSDFILKEWTAREASLPDAAKEIRDSAFNSDQLYTVLPIKEKILSKIVSPEFTEC